MRFEGPLEISPRCIGPPRLDSYQRLLARFYEQLFLLKALGQTRGIHTPEPLHTDRRQEARRSFLQNLSYICDFKKGGSACTAIALEDLETNYKFWVASNTEAGRVAAFLENALEILRNATRQTSTNLPHVKENFTRVCVGFSADRIREEKRCLQRSATESIRTLEKYQREPGMPNPPR